MADGLIWEVIGSLFMGFFVAWIAWYFFNREQTFTGTEFAAFITAIFGGTIVTVFSTFLVSDNKWIFWFYPIGLVAGMFGFAIFAFFAGNGKITIRGQLVAPGKAPAVKKPEPKEPETLIISE